jgi:3-isopropylmalate/(R)-2-methylmalate dehydratase large subunit
MNLVEKILARGSGRSQVEPGEVVVAKVDRLIMHDFSAYLTTRVYDEKVGLPIPDPERVVMVFDHLFSPPTERQADVLQHNRAWTRKNGSTLFDCGSGNIHHAALRNGMIQPGMIVVGSDSHTTVHGTIGALAVALGNDSHAGTVLPYGKAWFKVPETVRIVLTGMPPDGTTARDVALWLVNQLGEGSMIYKALEFSGSYIGGLSFWDRWLFPLLCVDLGAKCGFVEPDDVTRSFVQTLPGGNLDLLELSDAGEAASTRELDVSEVGPQVACPPTVGNTRPVESVAGTPIQWAELGGHGGGRLEDFAMAASVLRGRRVHPDVRFNLVPSSRQVFSEALAAGLVAELHEAGGTWFPASTGSNQASNMGAMAAGEAMISTHARNYPGRNGSADASMFLASALSVATAAAAGRIADPRDSLAGLKGMAA